MGSKGYAGFVIRKLLYAVITILAIICVNFVLFRLVPGDPVRLMFRDPRVSAHVIQDMYTRFGLDRPIWEQFLIYFRQLLFYGDLGFSFARQAPVLEVIMDRVPQTLLLMLPAISIAIILGTILGAISGWRTGTKFDAIIVTSALAWYSIPTFALSMILVIVFGFYLGWFPLRGMGTIASGLTGWEHWKDVAWHMVLPSVALLVGYVGQYVIITRNAMQEVMDQDYMMSARAKGLKGSVILRKHALRNAILPVVTITGLNVAFAIAGAITVETVHGWPGVGRLMYTAIVQRDYPVLQGLFMVFSVAVVMANLIIDLIYGYIDPRIKVGVRN